MWDQAAVIIWWQRKWASPSSARLSIQRCWQQMGMMSLPGGEHWDARNVFVHSSRRCSVLAPHDTLNGCSNLEKRISLSTLLQGLHSSVANMLVSQQTGQFGVILHVHQYTQCIAWHQVTLPVNCYMYMHCIAMCAVATSPGYQGKTVSIAV